MGGQWSGPTPKTQFPSLVIGGVWAFFWGFLLGVVVCGGQYIIYGGVSPLFRLLFPCFGVLRGFSWVYYSSSTWAIYGIVVWAARKRVDWISSILLAFFLDLFVAACYKYIFFM